MSEIRSGWFPVDGDDTFGYDVRLHSWTFNGEPISEEQASPIFDEKMAQRRERLARQDERTTEVLRG
jgi:hypothetical protein